MTHVLCLFQVIQRSLTRGGACGARESFRNLNSTGTYQVAVPTDQVSGLPFADIQQFCSELSLAPRGHYFRRDDRDHVVFCFAERADAVLFRERYGGDWFDAKAEDARRRTQQHDAIRC